MVDQRLKHSLASLLKLMFESWKTVQKQLVSNCQISFHDLHYSYWCPKTGFLLICSVTGLLRLQKLYQSFNESEFDGLIIRARRINNVDDCYDMLRKIDHQDPPPKRIVLDLSSRAAYENVLHQVGNS